MKNVLILSSEFPPGPGGIGNHAYSLASGLHRAGHQVRVLTLRRNFSEEKRFDALAPFVIDRFDSGKPFGKLRQVIRAIHSMSKQGPLVVIASGMAMLVFAGAYARMAGKGNMRFVLVAHGIDINPSGRLLRTVIMFAIRGFDMVIPVSSYTASRIKGVPPNKIQVINNGFDPSKFEVAWTPVEKKGSPSLITVGSVTFRKGQENVVRALPALVKVFPGVHYHMVGVEQDKDKIISIASTLGVGERITFHGVLSDEQLKSQLMASDVFVMLSNHDPSGDFEGFGIAVLEANHLGLPAIGSRESGLADAIDDGQSGLLINPRDVDALVEAVYKICSQRNVFASQAKQHAAAFYWDKVLQRYQKLLG